METEIMNAVLSGLATNSISYGAKNFVKKFFTKDKNGIVSAGLAVGYFYNFLGPIANELKSQKLTIQQGDQKKKFSTDNIKLKLILPSRLDIASLSLCEEEFRKLPKGSIIPQDQNCRPYGIGYSVTTKGKRQELTIVDYVRPVSAIKFYYEEILKFDTNKDKKWPDIQNVEIAVFEESIRAMLSKGNGSLVSKIEFSKLG